jgi:hypothetical protein
VNGKRLGNYLPIRPTAPTESGVAVIPTCTITASAAANKISIAAAPTGFNVNSPDNWFYVARYLQLSPGATSTLRRRTGIALETGDIGVPPIFPMAISLGFTIIQNYVYPVEVTLFDVYGRTSSPYRTSVVAGA